MCINKISVLKIVIISVIFVIFFFFSVIEINYRYKRAKNRPYTIFISQIKENEIQKAYTGLYPLVLKYDDEALAWIIDAYRNGYLGIEKDEIKANIFELRSQCKCLNTGQAEFEKFILFLKRDSTKEASVFLQAAAINGNKKSIDLINDQNYLKENSIRIDSEWKDYWEKFDYQNLYPYQLEIEGTTSEKENKLR